MRGKFAYVYGNSGSRQVQCQFGYILGNEYSIVLACTPSLIEFQTGDLFSNLSLAMETLGSGEGEGVLLVNIIVPNLTRVTTSGNHFMIHSIHCRQQKRCLYNLIGISESISHNISYFNLSKLAQLQMLVTTKLDPLSH